MSASLRAAFGSMGQPLSRVCQAARLLAFAVCLPTLADAGEVVIDNSAATLSGQWQASTLKGGFYQTDYVASPTTAKGSTITWCATLPETGAYQVYLNLPDGNSGQGLAANIPVSVAQSGYTTSANVNPNRAAGWRFVARTNFSAASPACVSITNPGGKGWILADAVKFVSGPTFTVTENRKQQIWGLGVELQLDSINSGNAGTTDELAAIPLDLEKSERQRLYGDLLKGFRYARIAMGLYYRGLTPDGKTLQPRYPSQLPDLVELMSASGIESLTPEYWSPAPHWKANNSFVGGKLKSFDSQFLNDFGDNVVKELKTFTDAGLKISMWGLQNEPGLPDAPYASARYSGTEYAKTFAAVAPKVKAAYPDIKIHVSSYDGQAGAQGRAVLRDPAALSLVDAWTWHRIGVDSEDQRGEARRRYFTANANGRPVFNNEFEYLSGGTSEARMINTAQSIMNWMSNIDSPTWFWLHASKPLGNSEAQGYALSIWRKPGDPNTQPQIATKPGHFDYVHYNYNAIAGFLAHMPWNSYRYEVLEAAPTRNQRVMSWKTPQGKTVFAITNRDSATYKYSLKLPTPMRLAGHQYDKEPRIKTQADGSGQYQGRPLPSQVGSEVEMSIPPMSIQFWVEE